MFNVGFCALFRWSCSGPSLHLSPPPTERSSIQRGAWLWAGAWLQRSSCGSPQWLPTSWHVQKEASWRWVRCLSEHKQPFIDGFKAISVVNVAVFFFLQRLKTLCSPSEKWHPYLDANRGERYSVERCSRRRAEATNSEQWRVNDENKTSIAR